MVGHVCACMRGPEVDTGNPSPLLSTLFFKTVFYYLVRLAGHQALGISCLCLSSAGVPDMPHRTWVFTWVLQIHTQVLWFALQIVHLALFSLRPKLAFYSKPVSSFNFSCHFILKGRLTPCTSYWLPTLPCTPQPQALRWWVCAGFQHCLLDLWEPKKHYVSISHPSGLQNSFILLPFLTICYAHHFESLFIWQY